MLAHLARLFSVQPILDLDYPLLELDPLLLEELELELELLLLPVLELLPELLELELLLGSVPRSSHPLRAPSPSVAAPESRSRNLRRERRFAASRGS